MERLTLSSPKIGVFRSMLRSLSVVALLAAVSSATSRGQDIYVANTNTGTVGEYTMSGGTVNPSLVTGLFQPAGIAVSGSDVFVSSGGSVGEYTTSGGTVNASLVTGLNGASFIAVTAPEPSTLALLGAGLVGYGFWRWRQKRSLSVTR